MKILYVKNNSERAREFQLKTIIYEENGQKFVKKQAFHKDAIPHLKKMKKSYTQLTQFIVNPKIKLAKIIAEEEDSLTFEFIEGISLEKQYKDAKKHSNEKAQQIIDSYMELLKSGFKTTRFNSKTMVTDEIKILFGDFDYNKLEGELCFEGVSNIDLIFSNIIFRNDDIYLIDYEWVFFTNIFVDYAAYRALHHNQNLWAPIEEHFLNTYVINTQGFHKIQDNYMHDRPNIVEQLQNRKLHIQELVEHVQGKEDHIQELALRIGALGEDLAHARSVVEERDAQLVYCRHQVESMRIKNRIKNLFYKFILGQKNNSLLEIDQQVSRLPHLYNYQSPELTPSLQKTLNNFTKNPLISIIMPVYNVSPKWLDIAIKSIEKQWYKHWELCIADDKSTNQDIITYLNSINNPKIKVTFLETNLNISGASNAALVLATGEYIALMDNDDEITPDALFEIVKVINAENAEFIYSDEDFIDTEGVCSNPHYKADFSPDLLLSHNYITHFTCFSKLLLDKVGIFNPKFDGAQDYDLFLRLTENTSRIAHIQKVLYHWRTLETSTSANSEAKPEALERGKLLIQEALARRNINATVLDTKMHHYFRVSYEIRGNPLVSIIIPFKDRPDLLDMCINSILEHTTYENYEIIGISNNSIESETFEMMKSLKEKDTRISFYEYNVDFNYSGINNHAVNIYAKGEHILLLNNDIEIISPQWIEAMLEHSQREEVGCVGAKLYYPNDTIQHAGVIIGLGGYAGHSHKMYPRDNPGYFNRLNIIQNFSALTAACLMVKKSIYLELGGLDEVDFKVAYNDVDFCLRIREKNYLNIFTPFAEAYHHESISRGYEETPEKIARFKQEKLALAKKHRKILTTGDPYYNPNLTHDREDFGIF